MLVQADFIHLEQISGSITPGSSFKTHFYLVKDFQTTIGPVSPIPGTNKA